MKGKQNMTNNDRNSSGNSVEDCPFQAGSSSAHTEKHLKHLCFEKEEELLDGFN